MEYTVKKLAHIAGVSTRTLRYYDEIGILKPARINSSGYRMYGQAEVDRLQQILFYKELGVSLDNIGEIINSPSFDRLTSLKEHREKLMEKRKQLDLIIANVNKTISSIERGINMDDKEKFEGLKQKMIDENEKDFGQEIRTKYGDEKVNQANDMIKGMTKGVVKLLLCFPFQVILSDKKGIPRYYIYHKFDPRLTPQVLLTYRKI